MPQLTGIYYSHLYNNEIITLIIIIIITSKIILPKILMIMISRNIINKI